MGHPQRCKAVGKRGECGYLWESRIENPKECPQCKSRGWRGVAKGADGGEGDTVADGKSIGGSNSVVESQPSKLLVAGSIPVSRSIESRKETGLAAIASVMSSKSEPQPTVEIPLCSVERKDEISGDWFSCGKDKGHKLDHGLWNKSERVD